MGLVALVELAELAELAASTVAAGVGPAAEQPEARARSVAFMHHFMVDGVALETRGSVAFR